MGDVETDVGLQELDMLGEVAMKHIHLIRGEEGDWVGLYLDGKLVDEGHSLDVEDTLTLLGLPFTTEERDLTIEGACPKTIEQSEEVL